MLLGDVDCTQDVSDVSEPELLETARVPGGESSLLSGDAELFELDRSEADEDVGDDNEDPDARGCFDVPTGSGRYARFFHVLLLL